MKNEPIKVMAVLIMLSASYSTASAQVIASLVGIDGTVRVRQDGETIRATESTDLSIGDQVRVGENSSARIVYSNGCEEFLEPGTIKNIDEEPVCETGGKADSNTAGIIIGTGVLLGGVGAVILLSDGGDDHGASP